MQCASLASGDPPNPSAAEERVLAERRELLTAKLRGTRSARVRAAVVRELRLFGPDAVPVLCLALKDRRERVRLAAAEVLAQIGDERAVPALAAALDRCFVGGSAKRQQLLSLGCFLVSVLFGMGHRFGLLPAGSPANEAVLFPLMLLQFVFFAFLVRLLSSRSSTAYVAALDAIAEREPTPALRAAIPALKEAVDAATLGYNLRRALRATIARIESQAPPLKNLPIASETPAVEGEQLPVPAGTLHREPEMLPRPLD